METPGAEFATARKVRFGADARTSEGERGTVTDVVVDPVTGAAISVGIRFGLFGRAVYASFGHLVVASEDGIELDVPRSELEAAPPDGARLTSSTLVSLDGKRIGKLAHITFDGVTCEPLRIVIDHGIAGEVVASAKALTKVGSAALEITSGRNGASPELTPFRSDSDLRMDVRQAIERYPRMRVDVAGVNIQAVDGVIWLRGHVSSELNRRLAEDLSRGVEGVAELHNLLIADSDLAASISSALAHDLATAEERIGVYPSLGRVHLRGLVRTAAARETAARIAAANHGAREVINELRVDPNATVLPVLAGVTGDVDLVPGGD
ncbi:MAG TPA: BON domain-containing protein [Ktedonobacterales bacterium]|nr:BON domain-containing protein [Ktedonobacterales bacterium]